ncbi:DUF6458 family protein [Isoptericola sp. b441]|uniref:DUF6458 family protein n=1 Tax=Actinotalea lenta TaxID=3064654 RepID=A0ABT9D612_9CELL|nr:MULTISPECIES: DUF6458 family protein [unclassified Isoptericola]MDO8106252.1 DUF6458 family protein [Isoptericola sp. b441]MDO8122028.1 DUF6458 family protein [Isoptericola sp. b490]
MGIGAGIFLIVVGAILTFAVNVSSDAVNLDLIGWIMMGAGLVALLVGLIMNAQRSNTSHREVVERRERGTEPPPA